MHWGDQTLRTQQQPAFNSSPIRGSVGRNDSFLVADESSAYEYQLVYILAEEKKEQHARLISELENWVRF